MLAREVKALSVPAFTQNFELPVSDLPDGTYFIKFENEIDKVIVRKK